MYHFAITVLLALALFKVVDVVLDAAPRLTRFHTPLTMALALAGVFAIDFSLFERWDVTLRHGWMGFALTGLVVAGCTSVWRALFHWLGTDEGDAPELRHPLNGRDRVRAA